MNDPVPSGHPPCGIPPGFRACCCTFTALPKLIGTFGELGLEGDRPRRCLRLPDGMPIRPHSKYFFDRLYSLDKIAEFLLPWFSAGHAPSGPREGMPPDDVRKLLLSNMVYAPGKTSRARSQNKNFHDFLVCGYAPAFARNPRVRATHFCWGGHRSSKGKKDAEPARCAHVLVLPVSYHTGETRVEEELRLTICTNKDVHGAMALAFAEGWDDSASSDVDGSKCEVCAFLRQYPSIKNVQRAWDSPGVLRMPEDSQIQLWHEVEEARRVAESLAHTTPAGRWTAVDANRTKASVAFKADSLFWAVRRASPKDVPIEKLRAILNEGLARGQGVASAGPTGTTMAVPVVSPMVAHVAASSGGDGSDQRRPRSTSPMTSNHPAIRDGAGAGADPSREPAGPDLFPATFPTGKKRKEHGGIIDCVPPVTKSKTVSCSNGRDGGFCVPTHHPAGLGSSAQRMVMDDGNAGSATDPGSTPDQASPSVASGATDVVEAGYMPLGPRDATVPNMIVGALEAQDMLLNSEEVAALLARLSPEDAMEVMGREVGCIEYRVALHPILTAILPVMAVVAPERVPADVLHVAAGGLRWHRVSVTEAARERREAKANEFLAGPKVDGQELAFIATEGAALPTAEEEAAFKKELVDAVKAFYRDYGGTTLSPTAVRHLVKVREGVLLRVVADARAIVYVNEGGSGGGVASARQEVVTDDNTEEGEDDEGEEDPPVPAISLGEPLLHMGGAPAPAPTAEPCSGRLHPVGITISGDADGDSPCAAAREASHDQPSPAAQDAKQKSISGDPLKRGTFSMFISVARAASLAPTEAGGSPELKTPRSRTSLADLRPKSLTNLADQSRYAPRSTVARSTAHVQPYESLEEPESGPAFAFSPLRAMDDLVPTKTAAAWSVDAVAQGLGVAGLCVELGPALKAAMAHDPPGSMSVNLRWFATDLERDREAIRLGAANDENLRGLVTRCTLQDLPALVYVSRAVDQAAAGATTDHSSPVGVCRDLAARGWSFIVAALPGLALVVYLITLILLGAS